MALRSPAPIDPRRRECVRLSCFERVCARGPPVGLTPAPGEAGPARPPGNRYGSLLSFPTARGRQSRPYAADAPHVTCGAAVGGSSLVSPSLKRMRRRLPKTL